MCGIFGYWSATPVAPEQLAVGTDLLGHRGPDGSGYLSADDGRLGFGHRRLAILDPDPRSRQPMLSADRRLAIVFNGEIYNFLEIRAELASRGHRFTTESDTEVILHAWAAWGPACQDRFNGMWALAIWDQAARRLFLSRDRFGVKPLLLLETPHGVAFASEAKAFHALPWPGASDAGRQRMLPGGMCATLAGPQAPLAVERWWRPLEYLSAPPASYPQQVGRFRELFQDACRLRLRSDVPVATAISGGLDSSSVLAMVNALRAEAVARRPRDWSRAYTAVARGTEHDELDFALAACQAAGVDPVVVDLFDRCDPDEVDDYLFLTDGQPLTNLSAWYLYRTMTRQGVKVSMDGQGADEILAGYYYDAFRVLQLEGSWLHRPLRTLDLVRTTRALTRGSPYIRLSGQRLLLLSSPALRRLLGLLPGGSGRQPPLWPERDAETWEMARTLPPLNAVLFMAVNHGIQDLLRRYDLLSMSSGLEIRMPFLDWRLVCYCLSLPATSLLGHGFTKRILRDAMRPDLPAKILERRRKLQFQGPVRQLLQDPLQPWVAAYPDLAGQAPAILASGRNAEVKDLGQRLVDAWRVRTYPRLLQSRISGLQQQHRQDRAALQQQMQQL